MNKNLIVTGGLGFIGSNFIKYLIRKKYKIINLDKVSYSSNFYNLKEFQNNKYYKFIKCDLNESLKLHKILIKYKPIGIFNLAAESHVIDPLMVRKNLFTAIFLVFIPYWKLLKNFILLIKIVSCFIFQQMKFLGIFLEADLQKIILTNQAHLMLLVKLPLII